MPACPRRRSASSGSPASPSTAKVAVQAETEPSRALTQITVVDGVARATVIAREVTTYTIKGAPDAARSVIIEHPRREGWTLTASARDSETPTAYRAQGRGPHR